MRKMWRETALLMRIQAYGFCGINTLIHGRDGRQKRRALGSLALGLLLAGMACGYAAMCSAALAVAGAQDMLPGLSAWVTTLLALGIGLFRGPEMIFGGRDTEGLRALPVHTVSLVGSRVLGVLLPEIAFALLIMGPAAFVYAAYGGHGAQSVVMLLLSACLMPVIPMAAALAVGTLIARLTLRMRHRALASAGLGIAVLAGVMAASERITMAYQRGTLDDAAVLHWGAGMIARMEGIYPPANWAAGAARGDVASLMLLALLSACVLAALVAGAAAGFERIADGLRGRAEPARRHGNVMRVHSPLGALFRKELRRYFASSAYVMNTAFGWVLYGLLTVKICLTPRGELEALLHLPTGGLNAWLPLAAAMFIGMSATTQCSVSMEGKQMDIMRALPVRPRDWLMAKLGLSVAAALPATVICGAALTFTQGLQAAQAALLLLVPVSSALFIGTLGLSLNLRFPDFDWNQEIQVVKQGIPVVTGVLTAMLLPAAVLGLAAAVGRPKLVTALFCAAQCVAAACLWREAVRRGIPR